MLASAQDCINRNNQCHTAHGGIEDRPEITNVDIVHFLIDILITCSIAKNDADIMPTLVEGEADRIFLAGIIEIDLLAIVIHLTVLHLQLFTDAGNNEGALLRTAEPGPLMQLLREFKRRCNVVDVDPGSIRYSEFRTVISISISLSTWKLSRKKSAATIRVWIITPCTL